MEYLSKNRGYNNNSGRVFTTENGLLQVKAKKPKIPKNNLPKPEYKNKDNVSLLLKSGNDRYFTKEEKLTERQGKVEVKPSKDLYVLDGGNKEPSLPIKPAQIARMN